MKIPEPSASYYAKDRKAWRKWLQKHHSEKLCIWLIIYHKDSGVPSVYYADAVEEALCFGWIDSRPNKRDAESYYLFFSRRNPKSKWSKLNKERVKKLLETGKIAPAGMEMIDLAKRTGTWDALDQIDKMIIPADLKKAFAKNRAAFKNFMSFPDSAKKMILQWIADAKKAETRTKRINETVVLAARNIRANQYTPKSK